MNAVLQTVTQQQKQKLSTTQANLKSCCLSVISKTSLNLKMARLHLNSSKLAYLKQLL